MKCSSAPETKNDVSDNLVDGQTDSISASDGPRRRDADLIEIDDTNKADSEYSVEDGRGEDTTEDEMDEDAVILKRPLGT